MQRIILSAALILGSSGCALTPYQETLLASRHASKVETPFGSGTGFPIRDDAYMTAWHVVEDLIPEQVTVNGWDVVEILRLPFLDAAVLVTGLHGEDPWPLADRTARPGEQVFKSGYGAGEHWWTEGIATEDPRRVAIDIFHGDSGGPLFDARGRVLGVVITIGTYGYDGRILHHCGIVPMPLILRALPEGFFEADPIDPIELPAPLPAPETSWERFQRLKKERLGD